MCMRFSIKIKSVRLKPSSSLSCDETRCEQKAERDSETDREKKATEINIRHQVPATRLRNGFRVARAHILILAQFSFVSSFFFSTRSAYTLQIEKIVIERNMSTIFSLLLFRTTLGTWHMTTHTLHEHDHERFGWCECECVCFLSSLFFSTLDSMHFSIVLHTIYGRVGTATQASVCPFGMIIEFVRVTCHCHTETHVPVSCVASTTCDTHFSAKQLCYNFNESHWNRTRNETQKKSRKIFSILIKIKFISANCLLKA